MVLFNENIYSGSQLDHVKKLKLQQLLQYKYMYIVCHHAVITKTN